MGESKLKGSGYLPSEERVKNVELSSLGKSLRTNIIEIHEIIHGVEIFSPFLLEHYVAH